MFRDYNTIYVLRGNTVEKSVDWTDLYQYDLIVKKNCVWILEDLIQKTETSMCRPFQIYLLDNIFNPDENSKIQKHKKLTKKQ